MEAAGYPGGTWSLAGLREHGSKLDCNHGFGIQQLYPHEVVLLLIISSAAIIRASSSTFQYEGCFGAVTLFRTFELEKMQIMENLLYEV